jgi:hypothetical protein
VVFYTLIGIIQGKLFLPQEYLMWIFKSPGARLIFIYEIFIIIGYFYFFNKNFREAIIWVINLKKSFFKKYKVLLICIFIVLNITLLYTILINVTVITKNKIIDYSFFSPLGKKYVYSDIVKINTGVYGKRLYLPITHNKGEFYYIIKLKDGTKIDLAEMGGSKNDADPRFIIEKLDIQFVSIGITKVSSMDNFKYCTQSLDKIYTTKIRNILQNKNK